jgi:NADPH:quinone reductase-like Zn-dependent oxidoreductase
MRAVAIQDAEAVPALTELPSREPGPGELLIEVHASSVNGFDVAVISGWVKEFMEYRYPIVPGKDFAGTVAGVGPEVTGFALGDAVFGVAMTPFVGSDGAFADYLVVGAGYGIASVPDGLDLATAGALGLAGTAALDALDALGLKAGHTCLISGATGGVGALAVQYATRAGVRVLATARAGEETDFVRGLGAEATVDYAADLDAEIRRVAPDGIDAVVHLAGDPGMLVTQLAPGGALASTLMFGSDQHPAAVSVLADPQRATLDRLAADVVSGRVRVPISRTYELADAPRALADFTGGTLGKLAVSVR